MLIFGPWRAADDLGRHLVAAELGRVADDPVAVDHEQRRERDARPGLAVQACRR